MEVSRLEELPPTERAAAQRVLDENGVDLNLEKEALLPHARIWSARFSGQRVGSVLVAWAVADELQIM